MNAPDQTTQQSGQSIRVRGTVQGVGFRPFVATLAKRFHITGEVSNDAEGVFIQAWGTVASLAQFKQNILDNPPPLAQIQSLETTELVTSNTTALFSIKHSVQGLTQTQVTADATLCEDCMQELFDPENRRYHYPFINCTHCGPRYSIIEKMPYDRAFTSMSVFEMCPDCQAEYEDPTHRRYHAQPNACPQCGPTLWLEDAQGHRLESQGDQIFTQLADWLKQGKIVAIKGIGGFHLACDARNQQSVAILRERKQRDAKPLAMMARSIEALSPYVDISDIEQQQLCSIQAPIVLLQQKAGHDLAENIAPGQNHLGFMLPYSPLHHLLMAELDFPIVLTSGNQSNTPQYTDNQQARDNLQGLADAFVMHDRTIEHRLDDSVVTVIDNQTRVLRRGRGYAPSCLYLHEDFTKAPAIVGMGAELKSTFCLLRHGQAVISQHIGDLENQPVLNEYITSLDHYIKLYDFSVEAIATDLHPDYLSTQYGNELAEHFDCVNNQVQHHHAHTAAVMAENGLGFKDKVLSIALDGLGMGPNKALWGAEVILASYTDFTRLATIQESALIGGSMAMREPWRNLYAHLANDWDDVSQDFSSLSVVNQLKQKPLHTLNQMLKQNINTPKSSSMGRVFDAVSAVLGICFSKQSFEGEAAMQLEALASKRFANEAINAYDMTIDFEQAVPQIRWQQMWRQILKDMAQSLPASTIAARFHHGLINSLTSLVLHCAEQYPQLPIVLCGGVFQNKLLHEGLTNKLTASQLKVITAARFPSNDGALSLGQAAITAAQLLSDGQYRPNFEKD